MELATEALSYNNQNIASKAPKLLLCSSIASVSDQGSNKGVTPLAGIGKEHPELNWYYLYLPNKELKRYIGVFSGRKSVKLRRRGFCHPAADLVRLGRRFILDAGFRHFDVCGFGGANSWDISGAKQQSAIKEEILSGRSLERINYI